MTAEADAEKKHTEASVLKLLRKRHAPNRRGGMAEYAYMEHVRNAGSFDATRTADAMALSLWKSRGYELAGFEVKVSRSDWLSELKQPEKAEVWTDVVDRWWVVAPKGIVQLDELPAAWGLMEVVGNEKLVVKKQAPLLTEKRHDIKRSFLVPLLRAAGAALKADPDEAAVQAARDEGWKKGYEDAGRDAGNWERNYSNLKVESDANRAAVREIESVLGVSIREWRDDDAGRAKQVADALRAALDGDKSIEVAKGRLKRMADELERIAGNLRGRVGE